MGETQRVSSWVGENEEEPLVVAYVGDREENCEWAYGEGSWGSRELSDGKDGASCVTSRVRGTDRGTDRGEERWDERGWDRFDNAGSWDDDTSV